MSKEDIVKRVAQAHNCITAIPVSGDSVISMANAILLLRELAEELQKEDRGTEGGPVQGG